MTMPRPKSDSTRINYYESNDVLSVIRHLANRRGHTISELLRTAVREYAIREYKLEQEKIDAAAE